MKTAQEKAQAETHMLKYQGRPQNHSTVDPNI